LVTPAVVFGALVGAMFWNVVTWLKGIPSSSSHALVGGLVGAGLAHAGFGSIQWSGLNKTLIAIVLSPVPGLMLTMAIMLVTRWMGVRATARAPNGHSAASTLFQPAPIRLGTASTMPRRRWASSPCSSIRPAICTASSTFRAGLP
jgi:phosphate/sulfate permease